MAPHRPKFPNRLGSFLKSVLARTVDLSSKYGTEGSFLGLEPVTVLLVEDSERFRRYISSMLRKNTRLQVIAEVSDGLEAVQRAGELKPDLILLDLTLPKINGLEIARQVRHLSPASRVLFVTSRPETYTNHL